MNIMFFILGIITGFITIALYCCVYVGAEADEKIKKMNNEKDHKNNNEQ